MTGAKSKKKPAPKKPKKGRPSLYTESLAARICRRLAEGESLRAICADKVMPDKATVLRWLADEGRFSRPVRARTGDAGRCAVRRSP